MQAYRTTKIQVLEDVPEGDLISITAAAELGNYTVSGIMRLIERGALPEYRLSQLPDDQQAFTSKSALQTLPPKPSKARAGKKRKKATK